MKPDDTLKILMRKNPHLYKHFIKIKKNEANRFIKSNTIVSLFLNIKRYHNLIKSSKLDLMSIHEFEKMDDTLSKLIRDNTILKFALSFLSKKNAFLLTNRARSKFGILYDLNLKRETLSNDFSKIARIDDTESFLTFLDGIIASHSSFSLNHIIRTIKEKSLNVDIISINHEKEELILKINDYRASNALGSTSWCISYGENWFKQYTENHSRYGIKASQYFVFNFKKDPIHKLSKVGITLSKDKFIFAADRFDRPLKATSPICKRVIKLHNELINDEFIFNNFVKRLSPNMDSLNHFMNCIKNIDLTSLSVSTLIMFSIKLDIFVEKSTAKRAEKLFLKTILNKYSSEDVVPEDLASLISSKYPKISRTLNKKGYKIKSAIY